MHNKTPRTLVKPLVNVSHFKNNTIKFLVHVRAFSQTLVSIKYIELYDTLWLPGIASSFP